MAGTKKTTRTKTTAGTKKSSTAKKTSMKKTALRKTSVPKTLIARSAETSALRAAAHGPGHDDIATRAYYLWLERGGWHGADREDWLRAERELNTQ